MSASRPSPQARAAPHSCPYVARQPNRLRQFSSSCRRRSDSEEQSIRRAATSAEEKPSSTASSTHLFSDLEHMRREWSVQAAASVSWEEWRGGREEGRGGEGKRGK